MATNFDKALAFTLKWEGGFVNHPKDPGGATNKGITQEVYTNYRHKQNLPSRTVAGISPAEVNEIYRRQYWDTIKGDALPDQLSIAAFDFAVNSGPKRALRYLQQAMLASPTPGGRLKYYLDAREAFLRSLSLFPIFGKGWINRLNALRQLLGVS